MADKQKVIALTTIHRTLEPGKAGDRANGIAPTPPKIQVIEPGTMFMTRNQAEFEELKKAEAIRLPDDGGPAVAAEIAVADTVEPQAEDADAAEPQAEKTTTKTTKKADSSDAKTSAKDDDSELV